MKKEELVSIIRKIVKEEVEQSLPNVLVEILASKVSDGQKLVTERIQPQKVDVQSAPRRSPVVGMEGGLPKPMKQFSTNPILNQILNETEGGVPTEDAVANTSALDMIKTVPQSELNENKNIAAVAGALTKDYRALIRAADEKAKTHRR